jgi:hypothetical protein
MGHRLPRLHRIAVFSGSDQRFILCSNPYRNGRNHRLILGEEPWPHTVGQSRSIPKIDFQKNAVPPSDLRRHAAQARQKN